LLGNVFSAGDEEAWILHPGELTSGREIRKHVCVTCWFTCDRGVSHELVRHRPASFCLGRALVIATTSVGTLAVKSRSFSPPASVLIQPHMGRS